MWKLKPIDAGGESYCLLPGAQYVVGRKNCDVLLQNDQSISRVHAQLTVTTRSSSQTATVLTVKDSSKYGTFLNEERLTGDSPKVLQSGDRLTFGVFHSKFKVEFEPLVVCSSCLDGEGKMSLCQDVQLLGGHLVSSWTPESTHLVMPSLKVTIKTICALICCRPIVVPAFFSELRKALQQKLPLPKFQSFYPDIDEPTLNKEDVDLNMRPERRSLFHGKTFIFLSAKQHKRLATVVGFGGGQSKLLEVGSLPTSVLESPSSCVINMATGDSQALLPAITKKWSDSVEDILHRKGLRFISESEIGLAAIYVSTDKFCNPLSTLESEMVRTKPEIPSATLSQSAAVEETVLQPTELDNITTYAPNSEPSQNISSICRMSTGGLSTVAETPEKEQRMGVVSGRDPPLSRSVTESALTSFRAKGRVNTDAQRDKSLLATRLENPIRSGRPLPVQPSLTNGHKNKSPQKQSALTNYFQPVNKKRTREESDGADQSKAKQARHGGEEMELEETGSTLQHRDPQAAAGAQSSRAQSGPNPGPAQEAHQGILFGETGKPMSIKRKEMSVLTPEEELEELESIMCDPMEDPEDLESFMCEPMNEPEAPVNKKSRLEPEEEVPTNKKSRLELEVQAPANKTSCLEPEVQAPTIKKSRLEPPPEIKTEETSFTVDPKAPIKSENGDNLPRNLLLVEFKSLVVADPVSLKRSALQPCNPNQKNFKKFRKVPVPGAEGLPNIIGGSDLVVHNRVKNSELEEWLRESTEEDQRNHREDTVGDDLFRYNPKTSKRK
ncbi:hypothetical protein AGOR_G00204230 [Albula goreensis]|uniref:Nibrin n=1 Tax=Albula goreensis TaxID=1534307 RepID=A0A8T3CNV4_9TELE|nr:hypothetical protein AGOR_G00204230 [Albula goreensis]